MSDPLTTLLVSSVVRNLISGADSGREVFSLRRMESRPADFRVAKGQLTFDAEGNDDRASAYYSRRAHVQGEWSGITIGRGYDLAQHSAEQRRVDLECAGLPFELIEQFEQVPSLKGTRARSYLGKNPLPELSSREQRSLFECVYQRYEETTRRIGDAEHNVARYGEVEWEGLNSKIRSVLVDLTFRGDYRENTRPMIQRAVAENDLSAFREVLMQRRLWSFVPQDRFNRRVDFLRD